MSDPVVEEIIGGVVWHYRPDTNDRGIIRQNFEENANRLLGELGA